MASYNKFQPTVQNLGRKVFNLNTDTLKVALSNSAPSAANNQLSDITQISSGNGYTTGGTALTGVGYTQSSGTAALTGTGPVFTASGGTIGPLQYVILYDDTATNDELISYYNYGSAITLNDGETLTIDFTTNTNIFTLA